MKTLFKTFAAIAVAAALSLAAAPAHAQDAVLEAAKDQGIVGEMYTGYLGIADPARATADIQRRVDEVNAKRLAIYTQLAKSEGQSVETVAALTAERQITRADQNEAIMPGPDEDWRRK